MPKIPNGSVRTYVELIHAQVTPTLLPRIFSQSVSPFGSDSPAHIFQILNFPADYRSLISPFPTILALTKIPYEQKISNEKRYVVVSQFCEDEARLTNSFAWS